GVARVGLDHVLVTAVVAASEEATTRLESLASVVAQMQSPSCDFGITASPGAVGQALRYFHAVCAAAAAGHFQPRPTLLTEHGVGGALVLTPRTLHPGRPDSRAAWKGRTAERDYIALCPVVNHST